MRTTVTLALLAVACAREPIAAPPTERERIEGLLTVIEESAIVFVRNGEDHDAAEAAAHLRKKWEYAGDRVKTAEQFIEHLASRSSMTGRPYHVRLEDRTKIAAGQWLTRRLADFDAATPGSREG